MELVKKYYPAKRTRTLLIRKEKKKGDEDKGMKEKKKSEGEDEDEDGAEYGDMKKKTGTLAKEHLRKIKAKKAKEEKE